MASARCVAGFVSERTSPITEFRLTLKLQVLSNWALRCLEVPHGCDEEGGRVEEVVTRKLRYASVAVPLQGRRSFSYWSLQ